MKKLLLLILVQAIPIILMVSSIVQHQALGTNVVIKSAPLDPKDMLYGQYINLNYEFNNIENVSTVIKDNSLKKKMELNTPTLYFVFKKSPSDKTYRLDHIQGNKPQNEIIYLKINDYYYSSEADRIEVYQMPYIKRYYFDERKSEIYNNGNKAYKVYATVYKGKWIINNVK